MRCWGRSHVASPQKPLRRHISNMKPGPMQNPPHLQCKRLRAQIESAPARHPPPVLWRILEVTLTQRSGRGSGIWQRGGSVFCIRQWAVTAKADRSTAITLDGCGWMEAPIEVSSKMWHYSFIDRAITAPGALISAPGIDQLRFRQTLPSPSQTLGRSKK